MILMDFIAGLAHTNLLDYTTLIVRMEVLGYTIPLAHTILLDYTTPIACISLLGFMHF
jgi:hypothetical protein